MPGSRNSAGADNRDFRASEARNIAALPLDFLDGRDADRQVGPAARDQGRQRRERRASAPMAAQQDLECPRSNIFTAQEPQPIEALAVVKRGERSAESWVSSIKLSRSATPCPPQAAKYWRDV
jgi:hypothetical protein